MANAIKLKLVLLNRLFLILIILIPGSILESNRQRSGFPLAESDSHHDGTSFSYVFIIQDGIPLIFRERAFVLGGKVSVGGENAPLGRKLYGQLKVRYVAR